MAKRPIHPSTGNANQDERTLPSSVDGERAVLGSILVQNSTYDTLRLRPEDFFSKHHQLLYAGIQTLLEAKVAVDYVTLKDEMARRGELAEVGGPSYIASLGDGVPMATNAQAYAAIVKEKAILRAIIDTSNQLSVAAYESSEPATAILSRADRAFLDLQNGSATSGLVDVRQSHRRFYAELQDRKTHKESLRGLTTGFTQLDEITLGWRPGSVIIVAARTSQGKSVFGLNTATAAAQAGARVAYYSYEMTAQELEDRLLASLSQVDHMRLQSGHWGSNEEGRVGHALITMGSLPIFFNDKRTNTVEDIRTETRRAKSQEPFGLIVVDYAQQIPGSLQRKAATRNDELAHIGRGLQGLAGELGVPILVLSQVTRGEGEPGLHDLRDSGTLEEAAHVVAILHRKHHDRDGWTTFKVLKQRNGPTGSLWLWMDRSTVTLSNPDGHGPTPDDAPKPEPRSQPQKRQRRFPDRSQGAPE